MSFVQRRTCQSPSISAMQACSPAGRRSTSYWDTSVLSLMLGRKACRLTALRLPGSAGVRHARRSLHEDGLILGDYPSFDINEGPALMIVVYVCVAAMNSTSVQTRV